MSAARSDYCRSDRAHRAKAFSDAVISSRAV